MADTSFNIKHFFGSLSLKNHTHVKKVEHTSKFSFGIYWWTLKNLKNQNFEKLKINYWRCHHFTHVYQKPQSHEVQFLIYRVRQTNFWKNVKSIWRCHHFKLVQQNIFNRVQQTFFVILGHFLLFYPTRDPKN